MKKTTIRWSDEEHKKLVELLQQEGVGVYGASGFMKRRVLQGRRVASVSYDPLRLEQNRMIHLVDSIADDYRAGRNITNDLNDLKKLVRGEQV